MDTSFQLCSNATEEERSDSLPPRSGSSSDESQHGSDLKRQKVEQSDDSEDSLKKSDNSSDVEIDEAAEEDDSDDSSSDDGYDDSIRYPQVTPFEFYFHYIMDSKMYDVADTAFCPVHLDNHNPKDSEDAYHARNVKKCVKFVIYEQYRKGNKMKLAKIENASSVLVCGYNYYITFSAETWPTREIKVYQAQIYYAPRGRVIETIVFREKPSPKQQQPQSPGNTGAGSAV